VFFEGLPQLSILTLRHCIINNSIEQFMTQIFSLPHITSVKLFYNYYQEITAENSTQYEQYLLSIMPLLWIKHRALILLPSSYFNNNEKKN